MPFFIFGENGFTVKKIGQSNERISRIYFFKIVDLKETTLPTIMAMDRSESVLQMPALIVLGSIKMNSTTAVYQLNILLHHIETIIKKQ